MNGDIGRRAACARDVAAVCDATGHATPTDTKAVKDERAVNPAAAHPPTVIAPTMPGPATARLDALSHRCRFEAHGRPPHQTEAWAMRHSVRPQHLWTH
jgi:hypothetical protein